MRSDTQCKDICSFEVQNHVNYMSISHFRSGVDLVYFLLACRNQTPKIKSLKPILFQKENQSFAFLKSRRCNREQLFLQFCSIIMSQIDLLRSSIEENNQLFFVAVVE